MSEEEAPRVRSTTLPCTALVHLPYHPALCTPLLLHRHPLSGYVLLHRHPLSGNVTQARYRDQE